MISFTEMIPIQLQRRMSFHKLNNLIKMKFPIRMFCDKNISVSPEIFSYSDSMSTSLPDIISQLQSETRSSVSNSRMMTSPIILKLNMILCQAVRAKTVIDIGVFTGSSSLAAALATNDDTKVIAVEKSKKYLDIASKYWKLAGIDHKIDVKIGDANDILDDLIEDGRKNLVDFIYIDADKVNYPDYFSKSIELTRPGGIIAVDNTLFRGLVLDQETDNKAARAIQRFNCFAKQCPDVNVVMLPLADGYTVAIKKMNYT